MRPVLALLLAISACAPRYAPSGPITTAQIQAALPIQHIEVQGIRTAYVDSGGAGPPIVLVHGLSSSLGFWDKQVAVLAGKGYRVLALDLPGYGASARPDAPLTPPWYAAFVADFMASVGAPRATVVGHSMGGQIALWLALDHAARVDRLVLAAPAGFERFTRGEARWMKEYWHEKRAMEADEEAIRANFRVVFNRPDALTERLIEERVRLAGTPEFAGTSVAVSRSVAGMLDHPVLDRLGEIRAPTLIVMGTDDRLIPNPIFHGGRSAAVARRGQAAIAGSQLVLLKGAGHGLQSDDAAGFDAAMLGFLGEN